MKRVFIIIIVCAFAQGVFAQDVRIGVKGAFNSTWLFNSNISDRGESADYEASWGSHLGLMFNYYFTDDLGIGIDLLYATHTQNFVGNTFDASGNGFAYAGEEVLTYLDIPVLFRITSEGGPYIEIGPQVGLLLGAKEDFFIAHDALNMYEYKAVDYKKDFNSVNIAAVLGFGYDIKASDNFFINLGLRFGYGLTDATVKLPEDAFDVEFEHSVFSALAHSNDTESYSYTKTNRAFGGLMLGLIYKP
ncbi:MAG: PorT family protein [Bacteroidia bacterium]|nr:PorT family protein [Bacteroidia bacterium]